MSFEEDNLYHENIETFEQLHLMCLLSMLQKEYDSWDKQFKILIKDKIKISILFIRTPPERMLTMVIYLLIINAVGFGVMLYDKFLAKNKLRRIPEKTLFGIAAFGGSIGCGRWTSAEKVFIIV